MCSERYPKAVTWSRVVTVVQSCRENALPSFWGPHRRHLLIMGRKFVLGSPGVSLGISSRLLLPLLRIPSCCEACLEFIVRNIGHNSAASGWFQGPDGPPNRVRSHAFMHPGLLSPRFMVLGVHFRDGGEESTATGFSESHHCFLASLPGG